MENISLLGCTGSIGTQALEVAALHPDRFRITALTAHSNAEKLFEQVRLFKPLFAALTGGECEIPADLKNVCAWSFGPDALREAAALPESDAVLDAVVGMAGLEAVLTAGKAGKRVLLANKEALVAGGEMVTSVFGPLKNHRLLPVDSEHSAIWQCLEAAGDNLPEEILLTASGGPFRTWEADRIRNASVTEALGHPNWHMGAKITVDSATMFNKGLEIIEARWLFDMPEDRIRVVVHPESIVHSAVRFRDGAVLAQMGVPDMRLPILYAMAWPDRLATGAEELDLFRVGKLTFEEPDERKFPAMALARAALREGGGAPCVMNAANEEAVYAFLGGRISFGSIYDIVSYVTETLRAGKLHCFEDVRECDLRARTLARERIKALQ